MLCRFLWWPQHQHYLWQPLRLSSSYRALFLGTELLGREVDQLSQCNIEVKDVWSDTSTSLYDLTGECLVLQVEGTGLAELKPISFFSSSIFLCHILCQGWKHVCMYMWCFYIYMKWFLKTTRQQYHSYMQNLFQWVIFCLITIQVWLIVMSFVKEY